MYCRGRGLATEVKKVTTAVSITEFTIGAGSLTITNAIDACMVVLLSF